MKLEMHYRLTKSTNGAEICESSKFDDDVAVAVEIWGSDSSYVTCPVCGNDVQGSDQNLNSHLDFHFRRFDEEVDLRTGNTVSFVRDQYNVKDPSAIKVLCTDNGFEEAVGHNPRELARYLSPVTA
ncbi:hypothetical protein MKX03_021254 [Papaver bracteatum]|nr:hypothetical protein MKX03_021254 [Papaver bracteatum]